MSPRATALIDRRSSPTDFDNAVIIQFMRLTIIIRSGTDGTIRDAICGYCKRPCSMEAQSCPHPACKTRFAAILVQIDSHAHVTDAQMAKFAQQISPRNSLLLRGGAILPHDNGPPWFNIVFDPGRTP
jgi:hypothetical protein